MKKTTLTLSLLLVISLFLAATSQVSGSTFNANNATNINENVPGVKPTKKVNDHTPGPPEKAKGKPVNIKGIIVTADAGSIVITQTDGKSVTVVITAETRISIASMGRDGGTANLLPGMQVGVQASEKEGILTARSIHVIPGKPAKSHNVGVVTDYQAGVSLTIAAKDGMSYTFLLSPDVKILPEERISLLTVGAYVTVISPRDVSTVDLIATGIVIHPAVPAGIETKITPQSTIQPPVQP
jgi:hypothetical protein